MALASKSVILSRWRYFRITEEERKINPLNYIFRIGGMDGKGI